MVVCLKHPEKLKSKHNSDSYLLSCLKSIIKVGYNQFLNVCINVDDFPANVWLMLRRNNADFDLKYFFFFLPTEKNYLKKENVTWFNSTSMATIEDFFIRLDIICLNLFLEEAPGCGK